MRETIRKSHLIYSSGVGGLTILKDGTSVLAMGLDYWFHNSQGYFSRSTQENNKLVDNRLTRRLRVGHLYSPPTAPANHFGENPFAHSKRGDQVGIPFTRFPLWHVCTNIRCRHLGERPQHGVGQVWCPICDFEMIQVPLVSACANGHLDEFQWKSWLTGCQCDEPAFELREGGRSGLSNFVLGCKRCGARRSLAGALLASHTAKCQGKRPWLGDAPPQNCDEPLTGVLRNSASIYYSNVVSSLVIPDRSVKAQKGLIDKLKQNSVLSALIGFYEDIDADFDNLKDSFIAQVEANAPEVIKENGKDLVLDAMAEHVQNPDAAAPMIKELDYRFEEYKSLQNPLKTGVLQVEKGDINQYKFSVNTSLESVSLVKSLTVTKALAGFSRLTPDTEETSYEGYEQLWKTRQPNPRERWLPAIQVKGEGIFLLFNEHEISRWEKQHNVIQRTAAVLNRVDHSGAIPEGLKPISPRFLLLHTLSHLLINRMVFHAGYSATSLNERIYSRENTGEVPGMAGILIYTASGDSDGSLGGLVRLGSPGELEDLFAEALENAKWCSSDPICMELGGQEGQGPDGLNLAACHSCAHVPETACENFNLLLDRGLVIGTLEDETIGFF